MSETFISEPTNTTSSGNKKSRHHSEALSSEEMAASLNMASEAIETGNKGKSAQRAKDAEESRKRMLDRFDKNTTKILAERKKAALEKSKAGADELRGKLKKSKAEKQKLKEKGQDAYESFEVIAPPVKVISSEGGSASGEIHNEDELETDMGEALKDLSRLGREKVEEKKKREEDKPKLDRILEAYEEAETAGKFMEYMLETSDMALTKEKAENDPAIRKYLKSNFKEKEFGVRYEDFVLALPSEEDYMAKAFGRKVEESESQHKTKVVPEKKSKAKEADKEENELMKAARKSAAKDVPFITKENIEESRRLAQKEEEKFIKSNQKFAPKLEEEPVVAQETVTSQAKEIKSVQERIIGTKDTMKEAIDMVKERAAPLQAEMDKIIQFFLQKNKDLKGDAAAAHQFLMGAEIKGWFKGKQRDMQAKYKEIFSSEIYKKWLKVKGKR